MSDLIHDNNNIQFEIPDEQDMKNERTSDGVTMEDESRFDGEDMENGGTSDGEVIDSIHESDDEGDNSNLVIPWYDPSHHLRMGYSIQVIFFNLLLIKKIFFLVIFIGIAKIDITISNSNKQHIPFCS